MADKHRPREVVLGDLLTRMEECVSEIQPASVYRLFKELLEVEKAEGVGTLERGDAAG